MSKRETAIIAGTGYWVKLREPDEMSKKYQMDICNLDSDTKEKLESKGVVVKNKQDDRGDFVTARSKFNVPAINKDNEPIDVDTAIGNGSDVKVKIGFNSDHPMVSQYGTSMYLNKVKVLNLVEYLPDNDFEEGVSESWDDEDIPV
tara:strand:- start:1302 stop:1739 length:438 start_codon:yes stop_codon:yes gene_type:complete